MKLLPGDEKTMDSQSCRRPDWSWVNEACDWIDARCFFTIQHWQLQNSISYQAHYRDDYGDKCNCMMALVCISWERYAASIKQLERNVTRTSASSNGTTNSLILLGSWLMLISKDSCSPFMWLTSSIWALALSSLRLRLVSGKEHQSSQVTASISGKQQVFHAGFTTIVD